MSFVSNIADVIRKLLSKLLWSGAVKMERRGVPRRLYMRQGSLNFLSHPAHPPADCTIRDISPAGAQIELETQFDEFMLAGPLRLYIQEHDHERNCAMIWRRHRFLGLKFEGAPVPTSRDYRHPLQRGSA